MIEQQLENLTTAIRDLIAVMQARPVAEPAEPAAPAAPAAPVDEPVAQPVALVVNDEPPAQETKRRGRPRKEEPVAAPVAPPVVEEPESEAEEQSASEPDFDAIEEPAEVVTVDTVRAAIRDIIVAGGKEKEDVTRKHIIRILAQHNNAKTLPELPPDVYPRVLAAIRAIPV